MELITINEAAKISGKSIQTIRRMIKQKKITVKRQKTPQGFNYLIIKESLLDFTHQYTQSGIQQVPVIQDTSREHRPVVEVNHELFKVEMERFNTTMQRLIDQGAKDKENFFQLIKTFQDRVFSLESHIKLLETPRPRWWQFWK